MSVKVISGWFQVRHFVLWKALTYLTHSLQNKHKILIHRFFGDATKPGFTNVPEVDFWGIFKDLQGHVLKIQGQLRESFVCACSTYPLHAVQQIQQNQTACHA